MTHALEISQLTVQGQSAIRLADLGFWVFPLIPGHKEPAIEEWPNEATRDYQKIINWWGHNPNYNIGIYTGKYKDDAALVAIDVDVKNGGKGDAELLRLEFAGWELPTTYVQTTPTGGRHLVFSCATPVRQGASVLGKNIDVRSRGGYIVGAGSCTPRGYYKAHSRPVAPCPEWVISACGQKRSVERVADAQVPAVQIDAHQAAARAKHYLLDVAPLAIEGTGGDNTTYKVAAQCKDFGVSEPLCLALMCAFWNPRCAPPWDYDELAEKVAHAYTYGENTIGAAAPETTFQPLSPPAAQTAPALNPIDLINQQYAYVIAGGGQHILWETKDAQGHAKVEHLPLDTFHGKFAPQTVQIGTGANTPISKLWMTSPNRREYDGLVFMPEQQPPPRFYNLWKGFSVYPADAGARDTSVDMFLEHVRENICKGNDTLATWLLGYFAHIFQRPWEKPLVALVFRGSKGVGKNAPVERIGALLGGHFLLTSNRRYLVGNFNGHLERCLLFALDEAFWSGDKQAEGVLKDLITGREHVIEHKGKEPYTVANKTRIVIIGNEDWLVPASYDERRFAVFDVGEKRKQDRTFFTQMRVGMEQGGYAVLLRYLLDYKITTDPNAAPDTEGLRDQKHQSLEPLQQWWLDCLTEETIIGHDFAGWPTEMECGDLRNAFFRYVRTRNIKSRVPDHRLFGMQLGRCAPSCVRTRRSKQLEDGSRPYVYPLYTVAHYRAEWEQFIQHTVDW